MRRLTRPTPTVIAICLLFAVNLVAFKWTSKFFQQQSGTVLLRYGDLMPKLAGPGYFGTDRFVVGQDKPNLIVYMSANGIKGQSISLLKFCEVLRQKGDSQFQTTLITSGVLPEVLQLLQDKLIGYTIINDSDEELARRLGLASGESGTFYFDQKGSCKFSSRQQPDPEDLRQLLTSPEIDASGKFTTVTKVEFGRGIPLPSFFIVDVLTLKRVRTVDLYSKSEQAWVFFLADCFSCGPPDPNAYVKQFADWQKSSKNTKTGLALVFDSAFLRRDVTTALERFKIGSPAYVAEDDLRPLSSFATSRGLAPTQPLMVRTDSAGAVVNISVIRKGGEPQASATVDVGDNGPAKEMQPISGLFKIWVWTFMTSILITSSITFRIDVDTP